MRVVIIYKQTTIRYKKDFALILNRTTLETSSFKVNNKKKSIRQFHGYDVTYKHYNAHSIQQLTK